MEFSPDPPATEFASVATMPLMAGRPISTPPSRDVRLREWRTRRGLTQSQLADKVGWTSAYVSRLENGERRLKIDQIVKLAKALGIEPAQLMVANQMPADDLDALISLAKKMRPEDRRRLIRIAESFIETDKP
jgi:transcriptional regulator with XRE-family HTH domain